MEKNEVSEMKKALLLSRKTFLSPQSVVKIRYVAGFYLGLCLCGDRQLFTLGFAFVEIGSFLP